MDSMVPRMMHNTKLGNQVPRDPQEKTEQLDPQAKRESMVSQENQANQGLGDPEEKWDPWVFLVLWVNLDLRVIMDPQVFQDKWGL